MTLRYKWLGIPGTLEEFADKAKQRGLEGVDVFIESPYNPSAFNFRVGVRGGGMMLRGVSTHTNEIRTPSYPAEMDDRTLEIMGARTHRDALKDAVKTAERLQELGFEATISRKPIGEARNAISAINRQYSHFL